MARPVEPARPVLQWVSLKLKPLFKLRASGPKKGESHRLCQVQECDLPPDSVHIILHC